MTAAGRPGGRGGFTFVELIAAVVLIAVLLSILLPAIQQSREGARRTACRSNLRQLVLALSAYHDAAGCLPPGSTAAVSPVRLDPAQHHFGWTVRVLPQLDRSDLYSRFDFAASAYANAADWMTGLPAPEPLHCMSQRRSVDAQSSYVGVHHDSFKPVGEDDSGLLYLNSSVRRDAIPDGAGQTLLLGETSIAYPVNWAFGTWATLRAPATAPPPLAPAYSFSGGYEFSFDLADPLNIGADLEGVSFSAPPGVGTYEAGLARHAIGLAHDAVMNVATAAGEVRTVPERMDADVLRSLAHRSDAAPLEGF